MILEEQTSGGEQDEGLLRVVRRRRRCEELCIKGEISEIACDAKSSTSKR